MHALYSLPRPNLRLSEPIGHVIRIRELIRAFQEIGVRISTISAGDQRTSEEVTKVYREGVKRWLPPMVSGVLRDLFYVAHNQAFQKNAYRQASAIMPIDFIIEHYSFFCQSGVYLAKKLNRPLILDDIAPIWEEEVYYRRSLQFLARQIQTRVFDQADSLVAVSGVIREYLIQSGAPEEKIVMITNGADCKRFRPGIGGEKIRAKYQLEEKVVVGFVGSFAPWHGLDLLMTVARDLARENGNLHFLIIGDGSSRAGLIQQMKQYGLEHQTTFTGAVPFEQVPAYMDAMDITVLPNTTTYCSPIKIYEYMAMAKVVVAPRYAPIQEVITDGRDGLLFPPGDQSALGQVILNTSKDENLRNRLGARARQKVLDCYSWTRHAESLCRIGATCPV